MKLRTLLSLSLVVATVTSITYPAFAQEGPEHRRSGPPGMRGGGPGRLSPEERERFDAARAKAEVDPAVVAADQDRKAVQKEFRDSMVKAIATKDPTLAEAFEKMESRRGRRMGPPPAGAPGEKPEAVAKDEKPHEKPEMPSPELREKLQAARKAAQDSPEVQKAAVKQSAAVDAYKTAFRTALLKADPTIGPIADKIDAGMKGRGGRWGDRGERGPRPPRGPEAPGTPEKAPEKASEKGPEMDAPGE